jgi:hypothetical protein
MWNNDRIEIFLIELSALVIIPSESIIVVGEELFYKLDFFRPEKAIGANLHCISSLLSVLYCPVGMKGGGVTGKGSINPNWSGCIHLTIRNSSGRVVATGRTLLATFL